MFIYLSAVTFIFHSEACFRLDTSELGKMISQLIDNIAQLPDKKLHLHDIFSHMANASYVSYG